MLLKELYMNKSHPFIPGIVPPAQRSGPAWWFAFMGDRLLVHLDSTSVKVPHLKNFSELGFTVLRQQYLGQLDHHHCYSVEVPEGTVAPAGMAFEGLRQVYGRLDEGLFWIATRA